MGHELENTEIRCCDLEKGAGSGGKARCRRGTQQRHHGDTQAAATEYKEVVFAQKATLGRETEGFFIYFLFLDPFFMVMAFFDLTISSTMPYFFASSESI